MCAYDDHPILRIFESVDYHLIIQKGKWNNFSRYLISGAVTSRIFKFESCEEKRRTSQKVENVKVK